MRMVETGSGACLFAEPVQGLFIIQRIFRQELKSYFAVEAGILRPIDGPHTAPAKFGEDAVVSDDLADGFRGSRHFSAW